MGKFGKCHLVIFTHSHIPPDQISLINKVAATVDVVTDIETVASLADRAVVDAIVIIEDSEKDSGIVRNLRQNPGVDQVPIIAVKSIHEATKIIPLVLGSRFQMPFFND
jgi:hypothetical protein